MAKNSKTKDKEKKRYTYPEVLEKYFPNAEEEVFEDDDFVLTIENFYDIITKVTQPEPPIPKKKGI